MKLYVLIFISFLGITKVFSQNEKLMNDANQLIEQGKYKQAIAVLDKVIQNKPTSTAIIRKANTQLKLKDYKGLFETLNYGILIMPDSAELYLERGGLYEVAKLYPEAIADFTTGYKKSTNNKLSASLLSNRGGTKAHIMDYKGGYEDLKIAIRLDSTNVNSYINIAPICNHLGKNDESVMYLDKAMHLDSTNIGTYVNIGYCYQNMDKHELAIKAFDKALQLNPNEPLGYSNRSYSKYKLADYKGALEDINKSIRLYPTNSYAYKVRALIEFAEGKYKPGCEDVSRALELGYSNQYGDEVLKLQSKYCQ